jgi:anti-sigma28 factor (negative regulator of flagellin synthesis)
MRITRRPTTTVPGLGEPPAVSEGSDAPASTAGGPITDRVQLSEAARLRQRLKSEVGDFGATSGGQVSALQDAVANGSYAPSPRAVADRLLAELAANLVA